MLSPLQDLGCDKNPESAPDREHLIPDLTWNPETSLVEVRVEEYTPRPRFLQARIESTPLKRGTALQAEGVDQLSSVHKGSSNFVVIIESWDVL